MARVPFPNEGLKHFLDVKADQYNRPEFINNDPISIPHQFSKKQDIEIAGFFAATLAWGQRVTIIKNCKTLMESMDQAPHDFILHHSEGDLKRFERFKHRTFNFTDLLYFIRFLRRHYQSHSTLEDLFVTSPHESTVEKGLIHFHDQFFSLPDFPSRTRKHVS